MKHLYSTYDGSDKETGRYPGLSLGIKGFGRLLESEARARKQIMDAQARGNDTHSIFNVYSSTDDVPDSTKNITQELIRLATDREITQRELLRILGFLAKHDPEGIDELRGKNVVYWNIQPAELEKSYALFREN